MKVTVIIPYKKDRGWLSNAIQSVEWQTYEDVEMIVVQGNCGVSKNINKGIEQSTGGLITYLCEDDMLPKNAISKSVSSFTDSVDFIHGKSIEFRGDLVTKGITYEPIIKTLTLANMVKHNYIHGGTVMYRKEVFDEVGMFNESLWTGEEYEFNLRLLSVGKKCKYVDEVLYYYRRHNAQKSVGNTDKIYQDLRRKQIETIRSWYR